MTVAAVFRNGVFEPTEPVNAREGTPARVELLASHTNDAPADPPPNAPGTVDPSRDWSWRSLRLIEWVAPDFDEPIEDFKDYM